MNTTYLLIRHGSTAYLGRSLSGRSPDVVLNEEGRLQADRLAVRLQDVPIRAIYTSPLERAIQTAEPLAVCRNLTPSRNENITEIDFGEWTGKTFEELNLDERWSQFNTFRSGTPAPGGESMLDVQRRVVSELEEMRDTYAGETVALVSHGDVIKACIFYYLGSSLDLHHRIAIDPASLSVLTLSKHDAQIRRLNDTGCLPL
jgi:probable phosphomutase (TIGR03848 family)